MKIYYYILGILLFPITLQSKSRIIQVSWTVNWIYALHPRCSFSCCYGSSFAITFVVYSAEGLFSDLKMNNSRLESWWIVLVLLTTNSWRPFKRDVFEVNIVLLKELIWLIDLFISQHFSANFKRLVFFFHEILFNLKAIDDFVCLWEYWLKSALNSLCYFSRFLNYVNRN